MHEHTHTTSEGPSSGELERARAWLYRGATTMRHHADCLAKLGQRGMAEELRRDADQASACARALFIRQAASRP